MVCLGFEPVAVGNNVWNAQKDPLSYATFYCDVISVQHDPKEFEILSKIWDLLLTTNIIIS